MHQGCGVQHLDHRAEADARVAGTAQRLGGEQKKQRTDALAATGHQVLRDVSDDIDLGGGLAGKLLLDGGQIVAQQVEDFFCSRYGKCAHWILE